MNTVLVVDDDKGFCDSVRRLLQEAAYEAVCAYDVQQAKDLMQAKNRRFDVALLDMYMADDTEAGLKLLRWIREEGVATTPIVLTAYGDIQNAVVAMKAGAFFYIQKGGEQQAELILVTVRNACEQGSAGTRRRANDREAQADSSRVGRSANWTQKNSRYL